MTFIPPLFHRLSTFPGSFVLVGVFRCAANHTWTKSGWLEHNGEPLREASGPEGAGRSGLANGWVVAVEVSSPPLLLLLVDAAGFSQQLCPHLCQVKKWKQQMRAEQRVIDRQIRGAFRWVGGACRLVGTAGNGMGRHGTGTLMIGKKAS